MVSRASAAIWVPTTSHRHLSEELYPQQGAWFSLGAECLAVNMKCDAYRARTTRRGCADRWIGTGRAGVRAAFGQPHRRTQSSQEIAGTFHGKPLRFGESPGSGGPSIVGRASGPDRVEGTGSGLRENG